MIKLCQLNNQSMNTLAETIQVSLLFSSCKITWQWQNGRQNAEIVKKAYQKWNSFWSIRQQRFKGKAHPKITGSQSIIPLKATGLVFWEDFCKKFRLNSFWKLSFASGSFHYIFWNLSLASGSFPSFFEAFCMVLEAFSTAASGRFDLAS